MASNTFIALSRALTGETNLDQAIASHYEVRLHAHFGGDFVRLLEAFGKDSGEKGEEEAVRNSLALEPGFHRVAREIIRAWYTGQFQTPNEVTEPPLEVAQYSNGLLWRVIGAHAPGFTNTGYGEWEKAP